MNPQKNYEIAQCTTLGQELISSQELSEIENPENEAQLHNLEVTDASAIAQKPNDSWISDHTKNLIVQSLLQVGETWLEDEINSSFSQTGSPGTSDDSQ